MDIVDKFVKEFQEKRSIYESIKTDAAHIVESALRDSGIMAITSARVKDPVRLKEKLLQRQQETTYNTFDDIEQDIVDFIGIRIALYFPNDQKRLTQLLDNYLKLKKQSISQTNKDKITFIHEDSPDTAQRITEYFLRTIHLQRKTQNHIELKFKSHRC